MSCSNLFHRSMMMKNLVSPPRVGTMWRKRALPPQQYLMPMFVPSCCVTFSTSTTSKIWPKHEPSQQLPQQQLPQQRQQQNPVHHTTTRVVIALSGGVDSSVAAALLQQQIQHCNNHSRHLNGNQHSIQLEAVHMTNWNHQDDDDDDTETGSAAVCYEQDYKDAARVAEHLSSSLSANENHSSSSQSAQSTALPLRRQWFHAEYWQHVFEPYLDELLQKGIMGNPDISCNTRIKFGALKEQVMKKNKNTNRHSDDDDDPMTGTAITKNGSTTWLATGHYARLWHVLPPPNDNNGNGLPPNMMRDYTQLLKQHLTASPDDAWLYRLYQERIRQGEEQQESQQKQDSQQETTTTNTNNSNHDIPWLLAAADLTKDQSYFLAGCTGKQLEQVLFPLGDFYKKRIPSHDHNSDDANDKNADNDSYYYNNKTVRELAVEWDLPTAHKRESMGICFVGKKRSWQDFVTDYCPPSEQRVQFVDIDSGRVLGETPQPSYAPLFTAGRGARIGGSKERYFCVGPLPESTQQSIVLNSNATTTPPPTKTLTALAEAQQQLDNVVWVCAGTNHPALYAESLTVQDMNWVLESVPEPLLAHEKEGHLRCSCRIRHLQDLTQCSVVRQPSDSGGYTYTIQLDEPIRGIMPGQMLVLYAAGGLVCLGGGPIHSRGPTLWEQERKTQDEGKWELINETTRKQQTTA